MPRRWDITGLGPYGFLVACVGGLFAVIVSLALVSRWVEQPLIDSLAPLVDGEWDRGFAVGLASGIAPWSFGWWLLVGRHRRAKREAPLGDLDDEGFEGDGFEDSAFEDDGFEDEGFERGESPSVGTRGGTVTTLIAAALCFATAVPFFILGPAGRSPSPETVQEERAEAERLPGGHDGWLTAMIAGGLLVFGHWAHSSSRPVAK